MNRSRLGNNLHFQNAIPKDLTPGVVYNFQCGLYNESYYDKCVRHLNVRIGTSSTDCLLFCNHSKPYDAFNILTRKSRKFLLELKESLASWYWEKNYLQKGTLHWHHCSYSTGPSNKIFSRILFVSIVTTLFLLNGLFYYSSMCKSMKTTVCVNGTVQ